MCIYCSFRIFIDISVNIIFENNYTLIGKHILLFSSVFLS